jgi:hypothetical protein
VGLYHGAKSGSHRGQPHRAEWNIVVGARVCSDVKPRGSITAVLALEAIQKMPEELALLPSLTFTIILFTNIFMLVASVRARALSVAPIENATTNTPQSSSALSDWPVGATL